VNAVGLKALAVLALTPFAFDGSRRRLETLFRSWPPTVFIGVFAASRCGACVLAFVVLNLPLPGDVRGYYASFGDAVLAGGRHEFSPYNPGFDYLLDLLRWWSPNLVGVVLFMIAAEVAALVLVRQILDRHAPEWSWPMAVLWLVSPVPLLYVALGGQDEGLILCVWSVVAALALGGRAVTAGLVVAFGFAGTNCWDCLRRCPSPDCRLPAPGRPASPPPRRRWLSACCASCWRFPSATC
jgi:hypothetical protein